MPNPFVVDTINYLGTSDCHLVQIGLTEDVDTIASLVQTLQSVNLHSYLLQWQSFVTSALLNFNDQYLINHFKE